MDPTDPESWDFPAWLFAFCKSKEKFGEARRLLVDSHKYVPSPTEEGNPMQALVLPIPDIDLEARFKKGGYESVYGWGIGRIILDPAYDAEFNGYKFEAKYFPERCPFEHIQPNPMRPVVEELIQMLDPFLFIKYGQRRDFKSVCLNVGHFSIIPI